MRKDLQHLNALRTFEVCAQLLSFTRAAEALNVTQAAVSHQIRQLEEHLGQKLFFRACRQVSLTEAGETLLRTLSKAFTSIEHTIGQLRQSVTIDHHLTVALTPAFSTRWLVPRLPAFWARHPGVELKLHHTLQCINLRRGEVDVAIRWGDGHWPGLVAEPLFGTRLSPVCTPEHLRADHPLRVPIDLAGYTLLHEDSHDDWHRWLDAAGCPEGSVRAGPVIDDSNALLMATLAGQGVALGRLALIRPELASAKLVQPFPLEIESRGRYWLLHDEAQDARPALLLFREFLQEQIAIDAA